MLKEQLQALLAEAQQLAAAEGEQVVFLQHILAGLLGMLRTTNNSDSRSCDVGGGSSLCQGSHNSGRSSSSSSSSPGEPAAVVLAVAALTAVSKHCSSRHVLQSHLGDAGQCRGEDGRAADGATVALHIPLTATLQDSVRLGGTVQQMQLQWDAILGLWCFTNVQFDKGVPVLAGLNTPPGSPQQQQLFGLLFSLHKTVQLQRALAGQGEALRLIAIAQTAAVATGMATGLQLQRAALSRYAAGSTAGSSSSSSSRSAGPSIAAVAADSAQRESQQGASGPTPSPAVVPQLLK